MRDCGVGGWTEKFGARSHMEARCGVSLVTMLRGRCGLSALKEARDRFAVVLTGDGSANKGVSSFFGGLELIMSP